MPKFSQLVKNFIIALPLMWILFLFLSLGINWISYSFKTFVEITIGSIFGVFIGGWISEKILSK